MVTGLWLAQALKREIRSRENKAFMRVYSIVGSVRCIFAAQRPEPVGVHQQAGEGFVGGQPGLAGCQLAFQCVALGQQGFGEAQFAQFQGATGQSA